MLQYGEYVISTASFRPGAWSRLSRFCGGAISSDALCTAAQQIFVPR